MSDAVISAYLESVERSGELGKSKRRLKLLEYLINAEVRGEGEGLKAYSIGIDVLDKPDDFDPAIDSSVRVEMGRLRTALAAFENSADATGEIVVEIPVGTYRPVVTQRTPQAMAAPKDAAVVTRRKPRRRAVAAFTAAVCFSLFAAFLTIRSPNEAPPQDYAAVVSITPLAGDPMLTAQVEAALRRSLVRNSMIATTSVIDEDNSQADFTLRGLVSPVNPYGNRVDIELLNEAVDHVVWAKSVVVGVQDDIEMRVSQGIGNELRVRLLGASKDFLEGRDPERLSPQQLFVMATWVPGPATNAVEWELERIALMDLALSKDPNLGAAHSVMADKLSYLANVYAPSDTAILRDEAETHATRAMELAPRNPDVVFNVAQSHWHAGRIAQSHVTMRRVVDLDPGHDLARFLSLVIPYTCAAPPPEVVAEAITFDADLSPDNPIRWLTLTWIAWLHLNAGDYETALAAEQRAALIFEIPYTFMRHAVLLNKLGRPDDAAEIIRRQQANWPDISPDHFAKVTLPRLCSESSQVGGLIGNYEELARAMRGRL